MPPMPPMPHSTATPEPENSRKGADNLPFDPSPTHLALELDFHGPSHHKLLPPNASPRNTNPSPTCFSKAHELFMSAFQDELPASTTEHFDFQSWCMSVGLPAFDENLHKSLPAPLARYSPPAPHPTPVTPALDYSPLVYNSPSSSSFDQLDTPLESFLAVGPTPFHGLGVPAAEESALLRRTMGLGTVEGQQQEQSAGWDVGEGSGSSCSDVGAGDQWRGPIEPAATSTSPQASVASPPAKRQRVSARKLATGIPQIYNGSGFSQNKERLLAAKREATPAPLPTDEKEKKREVNRRAAEASRKRKRKFVEGLQERISRLEDQLRSEGLIPVD